MFEKRKKIRLYNWKAKNRVGIYKVFTLGKQTEFIKITSSHKASISIHICRC